MPVKQTWLLLLAGKFATQMGWLVASAVLFPLFVVVEGDILPFLPALGFVFLGLLAGPFFTFFTAPVAALLAAFFGVPLDFFFFFFKFCSFRLVTQTKSVNAQIRNSRGPFLRGAQRTYG